MDGQHIAGRPPIEIASRDIGWARAIWVGSVSGFFLLALIGGGGPRYGSALNTPLELVSLPIALIALLLILAQPQTRTIKTALLICAGLLLLPLLQLVPLPPDIWMALPGRSFVVEAFDAAKLPMPWMPLTLSPPATLRSFLSLFPAVAIFLASLTLGHRERRLMTLGVIGFGLICVPFGLAQIAAGPESQLRLYDVTNTTSAVGFFANRNHYAALLFSIVPFIAAWMIHQVRAKGGERLGWVALMIVIYGIAILGLGMAQSRSGIALAMAAIFASIFLAWWRQQPSRRNPASRVVFVAALLGSCVVLQFGLAGILGRLQHDPLDDGRLTFARVTLRAAADVFPVGSGVGSFVPFYAMFETPADIGASYVNHAHNDWLEIWLEAGVPGLLLALTFVTWLAVATYRVWRHGDLSIDSLLAQAASISVLLLLAHSLVDYPLRTTALACLFAFACALCVYPTDRTKVNTQKIPRRQSGSSDNPYKDRRSSAQSVANSPQFRLKDSEKDSVGSPSNTTYEAGSLRTVEGVTRR